MNKLRQIPVVGIGIVCFLCLANVSESRLQDTNIAVRHPHIAHLSVKAQRPPVTVSNHAQVHPIRQRRPSIKLPTYTVKPSDTLWEIAQISGVTVASLKAMNNIGTDTIYVGQHIRVPQRWKAYIRAAQTATPLQRSRRSGFSEESSRQAQIVSTLGVPSTLLPVYEAAGREFGIPWPVLAAIHKTETDFAVSDCPVSSDGAMGPMQFMPATFAAYGVTAPGHQGRPNILDVDDAIYTAARMLSADGFSSNPSAAIFNYNHSPDYVKHILTLARVQPSP